MTTARKAAKGHGLATHTRLELFTLGEGLHYISQPAQERKVKGHLVENIAKSKRLAMFKAGHVQCVECGIVGTHWYIERHRNDKVMPFWINLYALLDDETEVLLTWDHKVPRSLGGSDDLSNSQCLCTICNGLKGNHLTIQEMLQLQQSPRYLAMLRVPIKNGKITNTLERVQLENDDLPGVNNVF